MNVAVADFTRLPGSQTRKKNIIFEWIDCLVLYEQQALLFLMNRVLERQDSMGFPRPLAWDEGMSLMMQLSVDIKNREKYLLLARQGSTNDIIACVIMTPGKLPICRHTAEISQVFVHPEYQGADIISYAMRDVLHQCDHLGIDTLDLSVREEVSEYQLWQDLGFETVSCIDNFARFDGIPFRACYLRQSVVELKKKVTPALA